MQHKTAIGNSVAGLPKRFRQELAKTSDNEQAAALMAVENAKNEVRERRERKWAFNNKLDPSSALIGELYKKFKGKRIKLEEKDQVPDEAKAKHKIKQHKNAKRKQMEAMMHVAVIRDKPIDPIVGWLNVYQQQEGTKRKKKKTVKRCYFKLEGHPDHSLKWYTDQCPMDKTTLACAVELKHVTFCTADYMDTLDEDEKTCMITVRKVGITIPTFEPEDDDNITENPQYTKKVISGIKKQGESKSKNKSKRGSKSITVEGSSSATATATSQYTTFMLCSRTQEMALTWAAAINSSIAAYRTCMEKGGGSKEEELSDDEGRDKDYNYKQRKEGGFQV